MNDLVQRLRDEVDAYQQQQDEIIVALGGRGILPSGIVAEIERLKQEVDDFAEGIADRTREIERLREAAKDYAAAAMEKQQENDRLRSALERIAGHDEEMHGHVVLIAREALEKKP